MVGIGYKVCLTEERTTRRRLYQVISLFFNDTTPWYSYRSAFILKPTVHFYSMGVAYAHAQRYFKHYMLGTEWRFLGNLVEMPSIARHWKELPYVPTYQRRGFWRIATGRETYNAPSGNQV